MTKLEIEQLRREHEGPTYRLVAQVAVVALVIGGTLGIASSPSTSRDAPSAHAAVAAPHANWSKEHGAVPPGDMVFEQPDPLMLTY